MILRSSHRLFRIARVLLVCLVFTQAALAASGCFMSSAGFANVAATAETADCDDTGSMNLNLCLAHCSADSQSLDANVLPVVAPPPALLLVVPLAIHSELPPRPRFTSVERTSDPPIPIRFCSFLI
jgi:hypothetical protein